MKSIKIVEQRARGETDGSFNITGGDQFRPKDFRLALRSSSFKTALLKFLLEDWKHDKYGHNIQHKKVVVTHEEQSLQYSNINRNRGVQ